MNSNIKLSRRLAAAAEFVREGSFVADIGTDHAYLPIYLCESGRIRGAVASDVNRGPAERAKAHVAAYGLSEKISVCLCDGLDGLESYAPEDICILGMGGELIVSLLSRVPWLKTEGKRLILQPMTHPEAVRSYLLDDGFSIVDEVLVEDDKIYQIICAEYTGGDDQYPRGQADLCFGAKNISRGGELLRAHLLHWIDILTQRIDGKRRGGKDDTSYEESLLEEINRILKENEK